VPERYAKLCMNGVRLRADEWPCHVPCGGYTRLYVQGRFTGISQAAADGTLVPCVVFTTIRKDVRKHERTDKNP